MIKVKKACVLFYNQRSISALTSVFSFWIYAFNIAQIENMSTQVEVREESSFKEAMVDVRSDESPTNW